jgi:hypothetical protein
MFCTITAVLYTTRGWYLLGVPPIGQDRPPFSDAYAQLATADACLLGAGEWEANVCFIPSANVLPHSQTYEPWLLFSRLGLKHNYYIAISFLMILLFYIAICLLFSPINMTEVIIFTALTFSSAIQLAIERGNFDILATLILIISGYLLSRSKLSTSILGCILLGFNTTLKIYSGLSTLFAWTATNAKRNVVIYASGISCLFAIAILRIENIIVLGHGAPEGATRFSTGAHLTFNTFGAGVSTFIVLATAIIAGGWLLIVMPKRTEYLCNFCKDSPQAAVFMMSYLTAVPLFFIKNSYDYRLILWMPMLALALKIRRQKTTLTHLSTLSATIVYLFLYVVLVELICNLLEAAASPNTFAPIEAVLVLGKHISMWLLVWLLSGIFIFISHDSIARKAIPPISTLAQF